MALAASSRFVDVGGGVPGGLGAGFARGVVFDVVADGAFEGVHVVHDGIELGVLGDGLAFGGVLLAKAGFEGIAGGGDGGGPSDRSVVAYEHGFVGRATGGKAAARGEQVLMRHRLIIAVAVAGARNVEFGRTGGGSDGVELGDQIGPLGAFDVCGAEAFALGGFLLAGGGFEQVDLCGHPVGFGFKDAAGRDDRDEIDEKLPATLAGFEIDADVIVHSEN